MTASDYGERWADLYDAVYANQFDTEGAINMISALAGDGRVLDLGIGTGRLAIPLRQRGVDVHGIEASPAMLERLHTDPVGATIPTVLGDFADVDIDGDFDVIVCAVSTLFMLPDPELQIRCLDRSRAHLTHRGVIVIEAFVPDPCRYPGGQRVEIRSIHNDNVHLVATRHDPVAQRYELAHLIIGTTGTDRRPVHLRYAWPSELDLMARLAGLRLDQRNAGWRLEPFGASSSQHVSLYRRA